MNAQFNHLSRRDFLRLAAASAAASMLTACGVSATPQAPSKSPVQLVYQDWRTDWFPAMAQEQLAKFNSQHPDIRVFYTPDPDNKVEKMVADMAAGTAPDLMSGCCDFFPEWADAGQLLDLRPYVAQDLDEATINEWSPAQYKALFTRDGVQFGLPQYHGSLALYYNKDMFDEAGVEYPTDDWTHDEYLQALTRLTVRNTDTSTRWGGMFDVSWDRIQIHVNGWGGNYVDPEDPTRCVMSFPKALGAMEWLRARMWDDHVMASFLDVQNKETRKAFIDQHIAMVEDGSWALKDILENTDFHVGIATFPAGPERKVTLGTTDGFGIFARTSYPDQAWEFLKFLVSQDYGRAMAQTHFLQPARSSLLPEWIEFIRKEYPERTQDVNIAAFTDGQVKGYSVTAEIFPKMVGVGKLTEDIWDQIFTLGKEPVTSMINVCRTIEGMQKDQAGLPADCLCGPEG
jgi:multiple sugar transport system substrate-binding protein